MAMLELLKTLPLGETAILCISLQKWLHLRSTCEVRAVTEDPTKDVTAKPGITVTLPRTRRGKAGTGKGRDGAFLPASSPRTLGLALPWARHLGWQRRGEQHREGFVPSLQSACRDLRASPTAACSGLSKHLRGKHKCLPGRNHLTLLRGGVWGWGRTTGTARQAQATAWGPQHVPLHGWRWCQ